LSRTGPTLTDIQIKDKVKDVHRIDTDDARTAGGLITVEVGIRVLLYLIPDLLIPVPCHPCNLGVFYLIPPLSVYSTYLLRYPLYHNMITGIKSSLIKYKSAK
jgi:hypothetical protein